MAKCNICGSENFEKLAHTNRCLGCGSLERHRCMRFALEKHGFIQAEPNSANVRILHLAPEECTASYLSKLYGACYLAADMRPEHYSWIKCLRMELPQGLGIFPEEYFDLIVHNHVMEHIPGDYHAHLAAFHRILKNKGKMIFTIPFNAGVKCRQGGEYLPDNESRERIFGQYDHLKIFGGDFLDVFKWLDCAFELLTPPQEYVNAHLCNDMVFCYGRGK